METICLRASSKTTRKTMSHKTIPSSDVGVTLKVEKPKEASPPPPHFPEDHIVLIESTDPGKDLEGTINNEIARQRRRYNRYLVCCDVGMTRHCFATLHFRSTIIEGPAMKMKWSL